MSRVDVTLCLCRGQTECGGEGGLPVEVKCSGVCNSGDTRRRKRKGVCYGGKLRVVEEKTVRTTERPSHEGRPQSRGEVL